MNSTVWIISGVFFLLAAIFGTIGICIGKSNKKRIEKCTMETVAKVVDIVGTNDSFAGETGGTLYHPVFEYYAGSQCYRETYLFGTTPCRFKVGEENVLYYNPDKPTQYVVEKDKTPKILSIVFTCVGAVILLLFIVTLIVCKYVLAV